MRSSRRKFIRCVSEISAKQKSETSPYNAFAVCRSSTGYKGSSHKIGLRQYEAKIEKAIKKEQKDHPQLSRIQALEIVRQELKHNPKFYG